MKRLFAVAALAAVLSPALAFAQTGDAVRRGEGTLVAADELDEGVVGLRNVGVDRVVVEDHRHRG